MFVLAVQIARLFWVMFASTGAFGDWRPFEPAIPGPAARTALFSAFDPFYRDAPAANDAVQQVTSLPFRLYGIRINEGSGLGSAIIADQSGQQSAFSVGEDIMPGVTLKAVAFDHVVISRNGAEENLFIDQSGSAPPLPPVALSGPPQAPAGGGTTLNPPPPSGSEPLSSQAILNGISFAPRTENGSVTGVVLNAQGSGDIFARAGFRPGDIVAQFNGAPIRSPQDLQSIKNAIKPGARLTLMVERGAATVPIAIIIPDNK
ncbi:MAG TPA: type II secretion system protein N [Sphingobium sp.]